MMKETLVLPAPEPAPAPVPVPLDAHQLLLDAIKQRISFRTKTVENFIEEEKTYKDNLSNVADYLSTLVKQRRRRSNMIVGKAAADTSQIPLPLNVSLTGNSMHKLPNETDRAYKFRLETEVEEMVRLLSVIQGMVQLHGDFFAGT